MKQPALRYDVVRGEDHGAGLRQFGAELNTRMSPGHVLGSKGFIVCGKVEWKSSAHQKNVFVFGIVSSVIADVLLVSNHLSCAVPVCPHSRMSLKVL